MVQVELLLSLAWVDANTRGQAWHSKSRQLPGPAELGTCGFTRCDGDLAIGGISNPGDGIAISWSLCKVAWSVAAGFGWLRATGPGIITACPNTAAGDIGVVNCGTLADLYYDHPVQLYGAGVCGTRGDRVDCGGPTNVKPTTWGAIKGMFK